MKGQLISRTEGNATDQLEDYWLQTADSETEVSISYAYDTYYRPTVRNTVAGSFTQTETFTYWDQGTDKTTAQIETYTTTVNGDTVEYMLVYDAHGNIIRISGDDNAQDIRYQYDNLGQLTREDNPYLGKYAPPIVVWGLNKNHNIDH